MIKRLVAARTVSTKPQLSSDDAHLFARLRDHAAGRADLVARQLRDGRGSLFLDPTRPTQTLTRPDPAQSFYAVPKSKKCNAIFNRLITNFLPLYKSTLSSLAQG